MWRWRGPAAPPWTAPTHAGPVCRADTPGIEAGPVFRAAAGSVPGGEHIRTRSGHVNIFSSEWQASGGRWDAAGGEGRKEMLDGARSGADATGGAVEWGGMGTGVRVCSKRVWQRQVGG